MADSNNSFKNKVIRKLKSGTWYPFYNTFYEKVPIDRREILLASRSGISLESNILAILTELSRPEYRKFRKVLAVQKNSHEQIEKKLAHYHISGETTIASVYSQDREWVIYIFALLYLLALCVIGGKQGIKGCLGLIFTFFCVIFVYLPLVYLRFSPFWAAVFICFLTTLVTMYLIGGPTKKTCAATLGTLAGVVLAGLSAWCFSKASGISGYNVSDIETLMTLWNTNRIQVGGLLFSGLLISCLGAVMDVAMSISSAIDEIYKQNTSLTRKELFKAGMRVGRDMMGTDSNTLILAFAGSSVSTLLLDYAYDLPYQQIINSNNIGIAIMQGLAGSFGIVLSVPLTVLICTVLFHKNEAVSQV